MLPNFWKQNLIAQRMSDDAITDLNACNRSYPASFVQLEFLCRSISKCPIDDIILDFKYVPQEIHHEFLRRFFPLAALYGDLISPIQVIALLFILAERIASPSSLVNRRIRTNSIRVRSVVVVRIAIVVHIGKVSRRNDAIF